MTKCKSEAMAAEIAAADRLSYGMSVFDGRYYVGTPAELEKIGAIMVCHHAYPKEE